MAPSSSYEPVVYEGWLGSAVAVLKGFVFGPRDPGGGGVRPGGRLDVAATTGGATPLLLVASATDASVEQVVAGDWKAPRDVIVTAETADNEEATSTTFMLGYDVAVPTPFARAARTWRGRGAAATLAGLRPTRRGRAAATWFARGGHVRLDGDVDVWGDRGGVAWATFTLNDAGDQATSTALNLIEREAGFVVKPFTAPSATAAVGGGVDVGGGGWRVDGAYDLNALAPYATLSRALPAGAGGALFDGPATIALHAAPASDTVMATFEAGDRVGGDRVAFGGPRGGRHPVKAFVKARVGKWGAVGGGGLPSVSDVGVGLLFERTFE